MATAIVNTQAGGAFRLTDAFLVGMDHIAYLTGDKVYAIQDGDTVRFVD